MSNIKNRKKLQLIQTIWDVMLCSQHFTFHWKLLVLVSRIEKCGTGGNNFDKWKETFRSDRPKWPDRSKLTTFKAGPEYSGRTKPKWYVPFDVPTEIFKILGWKESASYLCSFSKPLSIVFDVMRMISTQSALQVVRASFRFHLKESVGSSFPPGSIHVEFSKLIEKIWLLFPDLIFHVSSLPRFSYC